MKNQEQTKRLSEVLAVLAKAADKVEAWRQLYELMWPFVFALNYRLLRGARALAEDASQEVFLRLVRYCNFSKLQTPEPFRAYLAAMCVNVSRNYVKQIMKETQPSESGGTKHTEQFEWSPEQHFQAQELLRRISEPLNNVDRELVSLLVQGYKIPEIVDSVGLTYENAVVRVHRLRAKLRKLLKSQA